MCPESYKERVNDRELIKCSKQNGDICPFVYWCNNTNSYRPLRNTQETCKIRNFIEVPPKSSTVRFEKRGKLYIDLDNRVITLDNPFDFTPKYVTLYTKNGNYYINKKKGFK